MHFKSWKSQLNFKSDFSIRCNVCAENFLPSVAQNSILRCRDKISCLAVDKVSQCQAQEIYLRVHHKMLFINGTILISPYQD
jgi:hypothetical protein